MSISRSKIFWEQMSHILPNFLQVHCSPINLFHSEIRIIQFGALKLKICLKQSELLDFQNITRIFPKIELHFDEFLGQNLNTLISRRFVLLEVQFTYKFESLNLDE